MWGSVFPGQGSQHPGMGQFLFENFKIAKSRFEEASDCLKLNFKKLCFEGSEEDLQLTENTQPCLLLVSTVAHDVLSSNTDFRPRMSAGHSIGEYAALVTQGALDFTDALRAVRQRGKEMQSAVPKGQGGMCAVMGMNENQVREMCLWVERESDLKPLEPANFNSPGQIVISGRLTAIEWLQANFKKEALSEPPQRAKFILLKVSAPFHCSMMKPAEDTMRVYLNNIDIKDANHPIVQNFTALPTRSGPELRENLIRQISAPVLWTQCVERLIDNEVTRLVELGSGKVLAGLIKKIDSEKIQTFNMTNLEELKNLEKEING